MVAWLLVVLAIAPFAGLFVLGGDADAALRFLGWGAAIAAAVLGVARVGGWGRRLALRMRQGGGKRPLRGGLTE